MVGVTFQRWNDRLRNRWWLHQASGLRTPIANRELKPFFIVSAGRSGTTLLRKKLVNSDYIHIPPESDDFIPHNAIRFTKENRLGWDKLVRDILDDFRQQPFSKYWSTNLEGLEDILLSMPIGEHSYADLIDQLYTWVCRQHKPNLRVWGDKTPYLVYRLEWLRKIFPDARYIHLVRDGRAVVHSMVKRQGSSMESAAIRWRDSIRLFDLHRKYVAPKNILELRYEHLVAAPEDCLSTVCSFIGVTTETNLMTDRPVFLGDDVQTHHASIHKAITTNYLDTWKDELEPRDIQALNKMLVKELKNLLYQV